MTIVAVIAGVLLDGYALTHFFTHHRMGISAAAVGACGWVGAHSGIPLFAAEKGKRGAHGKARRTLRRAMRAAREAAAVKAAAEARKLAAA